MNALYVTRGICLGDECGQSSLMGLEKAIHHQTSTLRQNSNCKWHYFRGAFFTRAVYEEEQGVLDFARTERVIYTNLGMGGEIDQRIKHAGLGQWLTPHGVIELAHGRGRDELVHRAFKNFGHEELPFKRFQPNSAYYYCMLMAFFLYEAFKEDVCKEVVTVGAYATTLRRQTIAQLLEKKQIGRNTVTLLAH